MTNRVHASVDAVEAPCGNPARDSGVAQTRADQLSN